MFLKRNNSISLVSVNNAVNVKSRVYVANIRHVPPYVSPIVILDYLILIMGFSDI